MIFTRVYTENLKKKYLNHHRCARNVTQSICKYECMEIVAGSWMYSRYTRMIILNRKQKKQNAKEKFK